MYSMKSCLLTFSIIFSCGISEGYSIGGSSGSIPSPEANFHYGTAGFQEAPTTWYTISTNSYPNTVLLSKFRNTGTTYGKISLTPTGLTVEEPGNYCITFQAALLNPGKDTILVPVVLALDDWFDSNDPQVCDIATMAPNVIGDVHATKTVKNIMPGTTISLVMANAGAPLPQEVTVASWSISLLKLP